jgi:predicted nucleic acid-binding protein
VLSATVDSNTYISALNFGGTPLQVLNLARAGFIRLDVSEALLEEFAGVLRDKCGWREDDIVDAQQEIRSFANHVTPAEALTVVRADHDDRILEYAAAARSDYLVTGATGVWRQDGDYR